MEVVKHETCLEYFGRRLSEGWKCISLEGYNAVLLSPDGFRRELDLRNDIETLRPNAAGDTTNIIGQTPAENFHWDKVDEAVADEDATMVFESLSLTYNRDLYNLPVSSGSGTINKITLYFRIKARYNGNTTKGAIKSNSTVTETAEKNPYSDFGFVTWGTYSQEWALNPADAGAWEWADIDALQIGIALKAPSYEATYCTQVYVEVDYTPAVGLENKSANMAAKMIGAGLL